MAELNIATSGELLAPGAPGYIAALNAMGYQFGEGTPLFVFQGMPPVYAGGPDIDPISAARPPFVPTTTTLPPLPRDVLPPGQFDAEKLTQEEIRSLKQIVRERAQISPAEPNGRGLLDVFGGIKDRIVGFLGSALGAVFDGVSAVVRRITNVVGELAAATLPTIQELATAVASTATGALSFIADNLTDMADFGVTLASALLEPLYALLDAAGDKLRDWFMDFLRSLAAALGFVRDRLFDSRLERLI